MKIGMQIAESVKIEIRKDVENNFRNIKEYIIAMEEPVFEIKLKKQVKNCGASLRCILFLYGFFLVSCTADNRYDDIIRTTNMFLVHVKNKNVGSVQKLIASNLADIGKNEELLESDITHLSLLLNKYGIPSKEKFKIEKQHLNIGDEITVIIPLYEGREPDDRLIKAIIKVVFWSGYGNKKIGAYMIDTQYTPTMIDPLPINLIEE